MNDRESLMADIEAGTVIHRGAPKRNQIDITFKGFPLSVTFDDKGNTLFVSNEDIADYSTAELEKILDMEDISLHVVKGVEMLVQAPYVGFIYVEHHNPPQWLKRNISSVEEFWFCIAREFHTSWVLFEICESLTARRTNMHQWTRIKGEEPTRRQKPNVTKYC